ncbi:macrophage mannose receptor 1-like [Haliotis rufescens]|uniref:macrophage mannose receptor 1-like n=1 Tax=Haliotis rufescens TaxID=6454 RepID=UPI001EB054D0|nr:macrophage mannose receptor 1-like [Haliotis rufescens]
MLVWVLAFGVLNCETFVRGAPEDYVYVYGFATWQQASESCAHFGMNLLSIANETIFTEAKKYLAGTHGPGGVASGLWIGLRFVGSGTPDLSKFQWEDGSSPTWSSWTAGSPPSSIASSMSCGAIVTTTSAMNYEWEMDRCSKRRPFVCQGTTTKPVTPSTTMLLHIEPFYKNAEKGPHGETLFSRGTITAWPYMSNHLEFLEDCLVTCAEEAQCISAVFTDSKTPHCIRQQASPIV